MNILRNQIGIFLFAMFLIIATIGVSIVSNLSENIYNISNNTYTNFGLNTSSVAVFKTNVDGTMETIITGVNFLITVVVILTLYSSFVSQNTISSYFLYFIASLLSSSIFIYLFHQIYNTFVLTASNSVVINLNTFSNFLWVNFDNIILLNVIAFLLSFIFKKVGAR